MPNKKSRDAHDEAIKHRVHEDAPHAEEGGEETWLISYADMMTLLCGFFIMMFSMAKINTPDFERVRESISKEMGAEFHDPKQEFGKFLTNILQEAGVEKDAVVISDPYGVHVTFNSTLLYDPVSSELRPQSKALLAKLIPVIERQQIKDKKFYRIAIEGHTDSKPLVGGLYSSNWELSAARAVKVMRMFLDAGFQSRQVTPIGYADTYLSAPARTATGAWDEEILAKNRRVVIRILDPKNDGIPTPDQIDVPDPKTRAPAATPGTGAPAAAAQPVAPPAPGYSLGDLKDQPPGALKPPVPLLAQPPAQLPTPTALAPSAENSMPRPLPLQQPPMAPQQGFQNYTQPVYPTQAQQQQPVIIQFVQPTQQPTQQPGQQLGQQQPLQQPQIVEVAPPSQAVQPQQQPLVNTQPPPVTAPTTVKEPSRVPANTRSIDQLEKELENGSPEEKPAD